jgi:CRISPR-associated protein Cas1
MHAQSSAARNGVVVARGFGIKISLSRGHLIVHDGICDKRQTRRYHRATSGLKRLVLIGNTGYITLDALRWLHDTGAALVHLDTSGELITTSVANGPHLAALRRAQALAATGPAGVEIARGILAAKVEGQRALLDELPGGSDAVDPVEWALQEIQSATELPDLLAAEAQAAAAYWQAWSALPIPFPPAEARKLPDHWLTFGQRASLITGGPRLATNPAGAILNYLYALLEAETILACHALGLDPGLGIFHTDQRGRASLALDVMEAARPAVDAYILALLTQRTLSPREFVETREGACRITPRLAGDLADTCPAWGQHIAPEVEWVAHTLTKHSSARLPLRTPLTRRNRKEAWDERAPDRRRRRSRAEFVALLNTCRDCGAPLPDRRRRYCDEHRAERFAKQGPGARERAAQVLAQLRAEQRDPAHGGRAAVARGAKNAAHQRAVRAWEGERPDPATFEREILPGLRRAPLSEMVAATGLSEHYCSLIRLGKEVPHPRHWDAFRHSTETNEIEDQPTTPAPHQPAPSRNPPIAQIETLAGVPTSCRVSSPAAGTQATADSAANHALAQAALTLPPGR